MTETTRCVCGFRDRDAEHILRCTNPMGYNSPLECDRVTPRPPDFMAVPGKERL